MSNEVESACLTDSTLPNENRGTRPLSLLMLSLPYLPANSSSFLARMTWPSRPASLALPP